jgi:GNAT superfamily N-acetyltransferase
VHQVINPYQFRKASVLDIPVIYNLILQGSLTGSFTDSYLFPHGYAKLLIRLLKILLSSTNIDGNQSKTHFLILVQYNIETIGFLHYTQSSEAGLNVNIHLEHFAVLSAYQNQGHGTYIVHWLITQARKDKGNLTAVCTKYARAMQRILKKTSFVRSSIGSGLELYTLTYQPTECYSPRPPA